MMTTATQGRNEGSKNRTISKVKEKAELPTMYVSSKPRDVLDHGLEDEKWHYVWANVNHDQGIASLYMEGYRFVKLAEVKDRWKDDPRADFYHEDASGRVTYGHELRLMRIPQEEFLQRYTQLRNTHVSEGVKRLEQEFAESIDSGKHAGTIHASAKVSKDDDAGATTKTTLGGK